MPVNPFNPAEFGFPEGSPIFNYPPEARRAIIEARMRVQGAQAYVRFWDRVLTATEREELGNDVDACCQAHPISINLLCRIRKLQVERAVVEIAYRQGSLSPQDYEWLREVTGEPIPGEANFLGGAPRPRTPIWNRETGELRFDDEICRAIRVARADSIVPVLDDFEEAGWPQSVEFNGDSTDPQRIHQVVRRLNRNLNKIRFAVQDQQICWHRAS